MEEKQEVLTNEEKIKKNVYVEVVNDAVATQLQEFSKPFFGQMQKTIEEKFNLPSNESLLEYQKKWEKLNTSIDEIIKQLEINYQEAVKSHTKEVNEIKEISKQGIVDQVGALGKSIDLIQKRLIELAHILEGFSYLNDFDMSDESENPKQVKEEPKAKENIKETENDNSSEKEELKIEEKTETNVENNQENNELEKENMAQKEMINTLKEEIENLKSSINKNETQEKNNVEDNNLDNTNNDELINTREEKLKKREQLLLYMPLALLVFFIIVNVIFLLIKR